MKKVRILCLSFVCLLGAMCLQADELTARMVDEWALVIEHDKVGEISTNSRLSIAEPSYAAMYFYSRQMGDYWHENVLENADGVSRLVQLDDAKSKADFQLLDYSARKSENGGVLIHCAGKMARETEAVAEYAALCLPKQLIDGARFTLKLADGQEIGGSVPETDGHSFLATKCQRITFETKSCKIVIEVKNGDPLTILDRRQSGYEKGKCIFVGLVSRLMDTVLDSMIEVSVIPDDSQKQIEPLPQFAIEPEKKFQPMLFLDDIEKSKPKFPVILPKSYSESGEILEEGLSFSVKYDTKLGVEDQRRLQMAVERLEGVPAPLELRLATQEDNCHNHPDAFIIRREAERIVVIGQTPRAIFYGIQALREHDLSKTFRLEDWPDMDFRAIHCYFPYETGENVPQFFLENIWSRGRLTHLVIECQETQWEATRPLWQNRDEKPLSKEMLRAIIQTCRDNYIEPIPCIRLMSHCEWMFKSGHNLDFVENPDRPYNYDVTNPLTFKFVDKVLEEVIDLFHPKFLHIGHDEVDCARTLIYPSRPQNIEIGQAELFYRSVMHLHDFLGERNVRTMLWSDGLMSSSEIPSGNSVCKAEEVVEYRSRFPKDLVIMLWEYSDGLKYEAISELRKEGFSVVGCPWHKEGNIANMTQAVKGQEALGVCGTTWWPMYTWRYMVESCLPAQLTAQLLTPLLAWNSDAHRDIIAEQCSDYVFDSINIGYGEEKKKSADGLTVCLDGLANYCPQKEDAILKADFSEVLPPGKIVRVGRGEFLIPERDGKLAGVLFRNYPSAALFPDKLEVECTKRVAKVHLLGCLLGMVPEEPVIGLTVTFRYEDGGASEAKLQYNYSVGHIQGRSSYNLNSSNMVQGIGGRIWAFECQNPEPERKLSKIVLTSSNQGFILFGITCETLQ